MHFKPSPDYTNYLSDTSRPPDPRFANASLSVQATQLFSLNSANDTLAALGNLFGLLNFWALEETGNKVGDEGNGGDGGDGGDEDDEGDEGDEYDEPLEDEALEESLPGRAVDSEKRRKGVVGEDREPKRGRFYGSDEDTDMQYS